MVISAGSWKGITNNDSMWGDPYPDNDTYTEHQKFINIFAKDINTSQELNWYLKSHSATGKSTFELYNVINIRMAIPAFVGYSSAPAGPVSGKNFTTAKQRALVARETGRILTAADQSAFSNVNDLPSLNICLNGNTLVFGYGGQIRGVGRINICDCGKPSGHHNPGVIKSYNTGIIEKAVGGSKTSTVSWTGRRLPCIFTTGLGLYNIGSVEGILNNTDYGTGNSGPALSEAAAFYGYFKPTNANRQNRPITGISEDEIFFLNDASAKEISLYYYVEMDTVVFSDIRSEGGSGSCINLGTTSELWLKNCTFQNCESSNCGGAICADSNFFNIEDCSFTNCKAGGDGGAFFTNSYGSLYARSFKSNTYTWSVTDGKAQYNNLYNTRFFNNQSVGKPSMVRGSMDYVGGKGGGLAVYGVNYLTQFDSVIARNNYANLSGGFMYWEDSATDPSRVRTNFRNIVCGNNCTEDGQVDEQHYDNYAGFSGGTFCFSSQGRGSGYIDVTIAGNDYGRSSICGSRVLGYIPSMIQPVLGPGNIPVTEPTKASTSVPVYAKQYDPVLEQDYFLSSFGGAIFAEGVRLTLGNSELNGNTIIQGCYANDGGAIYAQEPRSAYFNHTVSTFSIAANCKVSNVTYQHYEYDWSMVGSNRYTDNNKVFIGTTSDGWNKYSYDGVDYDNNTNYSYDPVPAYVQRGEPLPTGRSYQFEYKECIINSDHCRFDTCSTENGKTDRQEVLNKGKSASERITGFNRANTQISRTVLYDKAGNVKYRAGVMPTDPTKIPLWILHPKVANQDDYFPYPEWMVTTSSTLDEMAGEYRTCMPYVNTNRNYLSGYSGGCITVGYLAQVFVRTNTEIINCQSAMYVQGGSIEFIDIQQESLARNGGEYLFGYPSYIPGENPRDTAHIVGNKERTWHYITFNGNRELVNGCYLTGCDFYEKTYVMTTHVNLTDAYKPCRLTIEGRVKINGNRYIDSTTGAIEDRNVFADPTTLRIILDRYTDKETAISIYPSFNTTESRKATTIISNWKPYGPTSTDGFEYYDGMIPNNIFVIDNKDDSRFNDLRIFRQNEYVYVGTEWDPVVIDVSILQTLDPAGGHQATEEQYIYNVAESKVQRPSFIYGWDNVRNTYKEKTDDNEIIAGYTYVGFVGRNELDQNADRMYKSWDFANDVFRGSKYNDGVRGSENMSTNRKLSLIMTDCESAGKQYKSCGCPNGMDCEHDNENLHHYTIRGGHENKYAAARNVVCVTSYSQLFWQFEGKNTQYRLYSDITIDTERTAANSNLSGAEISSSLKGPYVIYMDGYDITLNCPRYGLFDASATNYRTSKLAWPEAQNRPASIYVTPSEADTDRCQWVYLIGTDLDGDKLGAKSYVHCATNSIAPFIEVNGRDMFLKDVTIEGYETPRTTTVALNGDKSFISDIAREDDASIYIQSGRGLSVENATFSNIKTYYNHMIVSSNLWLNNVNIVNCEATAVGAGNTSNLYYDIIKKLSPTTADTLNHTKYYQIFNGVNITNCHALGAFDEVFDSTRELGTITDGSVLFNNVNVRNNFFYKYIFNSMISIANAEHIAAVFDGENHFVNNTIGTETMDEQNVFAFRFNRDAIDQQPTTEDEYDFSTYGNYMATFRAHSRTYINNNIIVSRDPVSGSLTRAALYLPGGAIDLWGHLEVANNKFTNMKTSTLASNMYEQYVTCGIEMASKRTQFSMGTGSIVCENNNGYTSVDGTGTAMDPTASWTMQMFIKSKVDFRKNLPVFRQKHGTKIIASESICYVHANYTGSPGDSTYQIYEGWYETEVEGYNTVEKAMLSNTLKVDPAINVAAASTDMRRIYAAGMNESCMVNLGADFITVKFAKMNLTRDAVTVENKLTQYIGVETDAYGNKRAIQTNLEMAVEDLGEGYFWVGPTEDFNDPSSLGYHKYAVYKQDFIPQYTNMTEDYIVYGFHTDKHSHPAALDLLDLPVDYWVEAGQAAGCYEPTDILNMTYQCMTDMSHLQSDHAKIYLRDNINFDYPRISTLSDGYSVCLNGHDLTISKQTFIDIKKSGVNVYITDCKRTGRIIFDQGDSETSANPICINVNNGTLRLSDVTLTVATGKQLYEPYVKVDGGDLNTANVIFENINYVEQNHAGGILQFGDNTVNPSAQKAIDYWSSNYYSAENIETMVDKFTYVMDDNGMLRIDRVFEKDDFENISVDENYVICLRGFHYDSTGKKVGIMTLQDSSYYDRAYLDSLAGGNVDFTTCTHLEFMMTTAAWGDVDPANIKDTKLRYNGITFGDENLATGSITFRNNVLTGENASLLKVNNANRIKLNNLRVSSNEFRNKAKGLRLANITTVSFIDDSYFKDNTTNDGESSLVYIDTNVDNTSIINNTYFENNKLTCIEMSPNSNGQLEIGDKDSDSSKDRFINNLTNLSAISLTNDIPTVAYKNVGYNNYIYNTNFKTNGNAIWTDRAPIFLSSVSITGDGTTGQGQYIVRYSADSTFQNTIKLSTASITNNYLDLFDGFSTTGSNRDNYLTSIKIKGLINITGNKAQVTGVTKDLDFFMYNQSTVIFDMDANDILDPNSIISIVPYDEGNYNDQLIFDKWNITHIKNFGKGAMYNSVFRYSVDAPYDYKTNNRQLFRNNSYIYSGTSYDEVKVYYIDNTSNVFDGQDTITYYVANYADGMYLDDPMISTASFAAQNRTLVGYVGRSSQFNDELVTWNFDTDTIVGSQHANNHNYPFMRELYAIVTDDSFTKTACGESVADTATHEDGTTHVLRGGASSGSGQAYYYNYVAVSTLPQLAYTYRRNNNFYGMQYYFANDLSIPDGMTTIRGKKVILMEGNTLNIGNMTNDVFDFDDDLSTIAYSAEHGVVISGCEKGLNRGFIRSVANTTIDGNLFTIASLSTYSYGDMSLFNIMFDEVDLSANNNLIQIISDNRATAKLMLDSIYTQDCHIDGKGLEVRNVKNVYLSNCQLDMNTLGRERLVDMSTDSANVGNINIYGIVTFNNNTSSASEIFKTSYYNMTINANAMFDVCRNTLEADNTTTPNVDKGNAVNIAYGDIALNGVHLWVTENNFVNTNASNENRLVAFRYITNNNKMTFNVGETWIKQVTTDRTDVLGYGLMVEGTQTATLFKQVRNTRLNALHTDIDISFETRGVEYPIFDTWYYSTIEKYNEASVSVAMVTTKSTLYGVFKPVVVSPVDDTMTIYKAGTGDNCKVYMGPKNGACPVFIYKRDDETEGELQDIQYVKANVPTSLERVAVFEEAGYTWRGPHQDGTTAYYTENELVPGSAKFIVLVANGTTGTIVGEVLKAMHVHRPAMGFEYNLASVSFMSATRGEDILTTDYPYFFLANDIVMPHDIIATWSAYKETVFSICLNGHSLTFEENRTYFDVKESNMTFIITDCQAHNHGGVTHTGNVFDDSTWGKIKTATTTNVDSAVPVIKVSNNTNVILSDINISEMEHTLFELSDVDKFTTYDVTMRANDKMHDPIIRSVGSGHMSEITFNDLEIYNNKVKNNATAMIDISGITKINYNNVNVRDNSIDSAQIIKHEDILESVQFANANFVDNRVATASNLLYLGGNMGEVTITGDALFENNEAIGETNGIVLDAELTGTLSIKGEADDLGVMHYPRFIDNINLNYMTNNSLGGAIYVGNDQMLFNIATGSIFRGNIAHEGGAIYTVGLMDNFTGVTFEDNEAVIGGAMSLTRGVLNLNEITFRNNTAHVQGGAMSADCSLTSTAIDITINGGRFVSNKVENNTTTTALGGAAIYARAESDVNMITFNMVNGVVFESNAIRGKSELRGSIFYLDQYSYIVINDAQFNDNIAEDDAIGGIYRSNEHGTLQIANALFDGNKAYDGAIYYSDQALNDGTGNVTIEDAIIHDNQDYAHVSDDVALINMVGDYETFNIIDSSFVDNLTGNTCHGNLIRTIGNNGSYLVRNVDFTGNGDERTYCLMHFAAIEQSGRAIVENCGFVSNRARSFVYVEGDPGISSYIDVRNITALNNNIDTKVATGSYVGILHFDGMRDGMNVQDVLMEGNTFGDHGDGILAQRVSQGIIASVSIINNNIFNGGSSGVFLAHSESMNQFSDLTIRGNEIRDTAKGFYIRDVILSGFDNLDMQDNLVNGSLYFSIDCYGIAVNNMIARNNRKQVANDFPLVIYSQRGIANDTYDVFDNITVENNTIDDITQDAGIIAVRGTSAANQNLVAFTGDVNINNNTANINSVIYLYEHSTFAFNDENGIANMRGNTIRKNGMASCIDAEPTTTLILAAKENNIVENSTRDRGAIVVATNSHLAIGNTVIISSNSTVLTDINETKNLVIGDVTITNHSGRLISTSSIIRMTRTSRDSNTLLYDTWSATGIVGYDDLRVARVDEELDYYFPNHLFRSDVKDLADGAYAYKVGQTGVGYGLDYTTIRFVELDGRLINDTPETESIEYVKKNVDVYVDWLVYNGPNKPARDVQSWLGPVDSYTDRGVVWDMKTHHADVFTKDLQYIVYSLHMHRYCGLASESICHHLNGETHPVTFYHELAIDPTMDIEAQKRIINSYTSTPYFYLTSDLNWNIVKQYDLVETFDRYVLCLNGHTLSLPIGASINNDRAKNVIITDCTGRGKVITYNDPTITSRENVVNVDNGIFELYNITLEAFKPKDNNTRRYINVDGSVNDARLFFERVTITSTSMTSNTNNSGFIYESGSRAKVCLDDCTIKGFDNFQGNFYYGANDGELHVRRSTFENNNTGRLFSINNMSRADFNDVLIKNNTNESSVIDGGNGSFIYAQNSTINMASGSELIGNKTRDKGLMYLSNSTLNVSQDAYNKNGVWTVPTLKIGGVGANEGNTANEGAALYMINSILNARRSTLEPQDIIAITGNKATKGAGIAIVNTATNHLYDLASVSIAHNIATTGAAIYMSNSNGYLQNAIISNNRADNGGALYYEGADTNELSIYNSTFDNNTLTSAINKHGGAIYVDTARMQILNNNRFTNNTNTIYNDGASVTLAFNGYNEHYPNNLASESVLFTENGGQYVFGANMNKESKYDMLTGMVTKNRATYTYKGYSQDNNNLKTNTTTFGGNFYMATNSTMDIFVDSTRSQIFKGNTAHPMQNGYTYVTFFANERDLLALRDVDSTTYTNFDPNKKYYKEIVGINNPDREGKGINYIPYYFVPAGTTKGNIYLGYKKSVLTVKADGDPTSSAYFVIDGHQVTEFDREVQINESIGTLPNATNMKKEKWTFVRYSTSTNVDDHRAATVSDYDPYWSNDNQTIYANWRRSKYTIKFEKGFSLATLKAGYSEPDPVVLETDQKFNLPDFPWEAVSTNFMWWEKADDETATYSNLQEIENLSIEEGATITLRGKWDLPSYYVHYIVATPVTASGKINTYTGNTATTVIRDIASFNIAKNDFKVPGYTFRGWSRNNYSGDITQAEAATDIYTEDQELGFDEFWPTDAEMLINNKYVYAVWKRNDNTVTLHINDNREKSGSTNGKLDKYITSDTGNISTANLASKVKFDTKFNTSVDTSLPTSGTRKGYTFGGFATISNIPIADRASYSELYAYSNDDYFVEPDDVDLYTLWVNNNYTIKFDKGVSSARVMPGFSEPVDINTRYDVQEQLPRNPWELDDASFRYWRLKGTTSTFSELSYVSNLTDVNNGVVTIEAVWDMSGFRIEYEVATPYSPSGIENIYTGNTVATRIPVDGIGYISNNGYVVDGYTFRGWSKTNYSHSIDAGEAVPESNLYMPNRQVSFAEFWPGGAGSADQVCKLYAVWKRNDIKLTLYRNDATVKDGSTNGVWDKYITTQTSVATMYEITVKYDTDLRNLPTSGTREGYVFRGFSTISIIDPAERASWSTLTSTNYLRLATHSKLWTVWANNKFNYTADPGAGQHWADGSPDGIKRGVFYYDQTICDVANNFLPLGKAISSDSTLTTFDYWSTGPYDYGTVLGYDEVQYTSYKTNTMVTTTWKYNTDQNFKAIYLSKPVEVTLDAGEGNGFLRPDGSYLRTLTATVSYGWKIGGVFVAYGYSQLPSPACPGYDHNSWYIDNPDGSGTHINIDNNTQWTYADKTVIKGNYTPHKYTIKYNRGAAPTGDDVTVTNVDYGTDITIIDNPFSYYCYTFAGWKIKDSDRTYDLTGNVTSQVRNWDNTYTATTSFIAYDYARNLSSTNNGTVTLEAQWTPTAYYVVFDKGTPSSPDSSKTNTVSGTMATQMMPIGELATLSDIGYSVPGYKFIGWADNYVDVSWITDGSEESYVVYGFNADNKIEVQLTANLDEYVTLYPVWKKTEVRLDLVYPKYTTNIVEAAKTYTTLFDGYVLPDVSNYVDYENEAFEVIAWAWKDPQDNHYETVDDAIAAMGADVVIDPVMPMVYRTEYGTKLYAISKAISTPIAYTMMNNVTRQIYDLDLTANPNMPTYVGMSTDVFVPVPTLGVSNFLGWVRDGENVPYKAIDTDPEFFNEELYLTAREATTSAIKLTAVFTMEDYSIIFSRNGRGHGAGNSTSDVVITGSWDGDLSIYIRPFFVAPGYQVDYYYDKDDHQFFVDQSYLMYPYIDTTTNSLYLLAHWVKEGGGGGGSTGGAPGVMNASALGGGSGNDKDKKIDPLTGAVALTDVKWFKDDLGRWHASSQTVGGSLGGWQYIDFNDKANWYMFENTGTMLTGWVANNDKYYYMQEKEDMKYEEGVMNADGWEFINGNQYFFGPDGSCLTSELVDPMNIQIYDANTKYYVPSVNMLQELSILEALAQQQMLEAQQAQQVGSTVINTMQDLMPIVELQEEVIVGQITEVPDLNPALEGYEMGPTVVANSQMGAAVANWEFSEDGKHQKLMLTNINGTAIENNTQFATDGWYVVNGSNWYMFDSNGDMVTGLYDDGLGNTYYLAEDSELKGTMQTGWVKVNGYEYYFVEQGYDSFGVYGTMLRGGTAPDGSEVGPDGKRLTGR